MYYCLIHKKRELLLQTLLLRSLEIFFPCSLNWISQSVSQVFWKCIKEWLQLKCGGNSSGRKWSWWMVVWGADVYFEYGRMYWSWGKATERLHSPPFIRKTGDPAFPIHSTVVYTKEPMMEGCRVLREQC